MFCALGSDVLRDGFSTLNQHCDKQKCCSILKKNRGHPIKIIFQPRARKTCAYPLALRSRVFLKLPVILNRWQR